MNNFGDVIQNQQETYPYYEPTTNWQQGGHQQHRNYQRAGVGVAYRDTVGTSGDLTSGPDAATHTGTSGSIAAPLGMEPRPAYAQKAFSEQIKYSGHNHATHNIHQPTHQAHPSHQPTHFTTPVHSQPAMTHQPTHMSHNNIAGIMTHRNEANYLEQKIQRLENDNFILYQQNDKIKNQYKQGMTHHITSMTH